MSNLKRVITLPRRNDEPDTKKIVTVMQNKFGADRIAVTKLSALWSKAAEKFLEKNGLLIVGNIKKHQSVVALADGLVVELYR